MASLSRRSDHRELHRVRTLSTCPNRYGHPTVEFSRRHFNVSSGKTEAYYILATRPEVADPYIYLGFQRPPSRQELRRQIVEQDIAAMEKCFDKIPVQPGDV